MLDCTKIDSSDYSPDHSSVRAFWTAANYITLALLYLRDNVLLHTPLYSYHFKDTILGHWGACPGINAVYAALSDNVRRSDHPVRLVIGTGHAGPAALACAFLDGTLEEIYPEYCRNEQGLAQLCRRFGASHGFDTEIAPEYPGALYAGGELGGALAVAQGCAFQAPGTVTVCLVGDGELETALTQAAWQGFRFLSKHQDGAVLPIVNANGWRMGGRPVSASMSNEELRCFFRAHRLAPLFVQADIGELIGALDEAMEMLCRYQQSGHIKTAPWPVVVFRSPKGWTAPAELGGVPFVGTHRSHKPLLRNPKDDPEQFAEIESWLQQYKPSELFDGDGRPRETVIACLPKRNKRLSRLLSVKELSTKSSFTLPQMQGKGLIRIEEGSFDASNSVAALESALAVWGAESSFDDLMVFSPDELSSNRFGAIVRPLGLRSSTSQATVEEFTTPPGRIIEILNEQMCFAWQYGYAQTGRRSVFITYEAFAPLVDSMVAQALKFLHRCRNLEWRKPSVGINIILTSLGWYNSPTHHNPGFIETLVGRGLPHVRLFTPATPGEAVTALRDMLSSVNRLNVLVVGKHPLPLLKAQAGHVHDTSLRPWRILKNDDAEKGVALVGVGDCMVEECLGAAKILEENREPVPASVITLNELSLLDRPDDPECQNFWSSLAQYRAVVWAYMGYPRALAGLLWQQRQPPSTILGFRDQTRSCDAAGRFEENGASRRQISEAAHKLMALECPSGYRKPSTVLQTTTREDSEMN
jgi:xylulose-5-phosphate/fructose-6-phosphate phosphoketolase